MEMLMVVVIMRINGDRLGTGWSSWWRLMVR
jgi:hypothetical protein